jgi:hypothetical protein
MAEGHRVAGFEVLRGSRQDALKAIQKKSNDLERLK